MAGLVDWSILGQMPDPYKRAQQEVFMPLQGLGQAGAAWADLYRQNKANEILKNAMEAWDYSPNDAYESILKESPDMGDLDTEAEGIARTSSINQRQMLGSPEQPSNVVGSYDVARGLAADDRVARAKQFEIDRNRRLDEVFGTGPEGADSRKKYEAQKEIASKYFKPGMSEEARYRAIAAAVAPWDTGLSDKMTKYAEVRSLEEAEIRRKMAAEKAEGPTVALTKLNQYVDHVNSQLQEEKDNYRYLVDNGTAADREASRVRLGKLSAELNRLADVGKTITTGTEYESIYSGVGAKDNTDDKNGQQLQQTQPEETTQLYTIPKLVDGKASTIQTLKEQVKADYDAGKFGPKATKNDLDAALKNIDIQATKFGEAGAAKAAADSDWAELNNNVQFIKSIQDYNNAKEARRYLKNALNEKGIVLDDPTIGQIKFNIARAVTGPGIITDSELSNANQAGSTVDKVLDQQGLLKYFTKRNAEAIKGSIRAALSNTTTYNTMVENLNNRISNYNERHPSYKKNLYGRDGAGGGSKEPKATMRYNPKTGKLEEIK